MGDGLLAYGQLAAGRHVEHQLAQRAADFGLVGLELIEAVEARITSYNVCYTKLLRFLSKYRGAMKAK